MAVKAPDARSFTASPASRGCTTTAQLPSVDSHMRSPATQHGNQAAEPTWPLLLLLLLLLPLPLLLAEQASSAVPRRPFSISLALLPPLLLAVLLLLKALLLLRASCVNCLLRLLGRLLDCTASPWCPVPVSGGCIASAMNTFVLEALAAHAMMLGCTWKGFLTCAHIAHGNHNAPLGDEHVRHASFTNAASALVV